MPRKKQKPTSCDATFLSDGGYKPDLVVQGPEIFTIPNSDAWVDKYAPSSIDEVCGNEVAKGELMECLANDISVPIVVYGGMGVGKRTTVSLCLEAFDFDINEYSMSMSSLQDIRRECDPDANVLLALCSSSKRKAVVCLDASSLSRNEHNELFSMMRHIAKTTLCVIIDTSPHEHCTCIRFEDPTPEDISIHLAWIAAEENIPFTESDVPMSNDVRACVQALQLGETSSVYIEAGDSDFCVAAHAAQSMRACGNSLEAVVSLSDAMVITDCAPIQDRSMATYYAAGIATHFKFERSTTLSSLARNAQIVRQKLRINSAWKVWALSPVTDALAKQILSHQLLNDRLQGTTIERADALRIICRSDVPSVKRMIDQKVKTLKTLHDS